MVTTTNNNDSIWKCLMGLHLQSSYTQIAFSNLDILTATSHTRLSARDHSTSRTRIGGKGGAGPSSLHTTLEGPTE